MSSTTRTAAADVVAEYRARTPASAAVFARARRVLPGGETRAVTTYPPYPVAIVEGQGARLRDADGRTYLDLVNNYTSLVHGNAFPPVTEAVSRLLPSGTAFAGPHLRQIELAELLAARIGSIDRVRFTNSGTEAALLAVRIAQRATGRRRLLLFEGGYHGSADQLRSDHPDVVTAPWNDTDRAVELLADTGIAAVLAEPFLGAGGVRPAAPGFLAAVERAAHDHGALFVLDEVQSLRNDYAGTQSRLGLDPDLTLLAKIIGGGFPVGAVAGRADLLELTVAGATTRHVAHSGTFNGHLAAAVAGIVTLQHLDEHTIAGLDAAAARLAGTIEEAACAAGILAEVTRAGSILNVHLARPGDLATLHMALMMECVYTTPRGMINLSTALSTVDLDQVGAAYRRALHRVAG